MMRKIQRKQKSSAGAASENTDEDEQVDFDEPAKAYSGNDGEEDIWQHFVKLEGNFAQCGFCDKKLDCGTSLIFLRGHLKRRHPAVTNKKKVISSKIIKVTKAEEKVVNSDGQLEKNDPDSAGMGKCRAGVWQHFVRLNKTSAQCKVCKKDLNYSASISNLKRHLKVKHPEEHTQLTSPKVSFSWQKKEKEKNTPDKEKKRKRTGKLSAVDIKECVDENEILNSDSEYQPETDDSDHLRTDVKEKTPKRQKSDVWSSFEKVDHATARCTLCEEIVDCKPLANLKRHLDRHEESASESVGDLAEEEDQLLENDDSDSLQTTLDETCSRLLRRRKSDLWNHFATLSKEIARCKHCRKNLNYRSSATNLRRHLRVMHPRVHDQLGQARSAEKKTGTSSRKEPTPKASKKNAHLPSRTEKLPAKKKSVVQKADSSFAKSKMPVADEDTSNEDSSVDNEMPSAIHDASDGDSADERDMQMVVRETSEGNVVEQRMVQSSDDAFFRISNQSEAPCGRKGPKVSNAMNENRKKTISTPTVVRPKKVHAKRKRSRLWDFFTVIDETFAECNTCKHRLVHKSGLSNLAKHYSMKHSAPSTDLQHCPPGTAQAGQMSEIEMAVNSLNNNEAQLPPESQQPIEQTSGDPQPKRRTRKKNADNHWRCAIWKLFEKLDETFSQCKSCLKRISHRSTNANLLKHTRIKHPDIYYKFEERLKDFSHNVNILVDHFFPESLITASVPGNSAASQTVSSHEAEQQMPHQEYQMTENQPPHMYDNMQSYSFPVIFVQEEEAVPTTSETIAATSVITSAPPNPIHAPPTSIQTTPINAPPILPGPSYNMGGHSIITSHDQNSTHLPNHTQDPAPLSMAVNVPSNPRVNLHPPVYMGEGVAHNVGVVGNHNVGVGGNHNVGGVSPYPGPFNANYQQVLTTSYNVNGGVVQSSDRLIGMVEESNQLLRGMQTAIERQSDVLIRLAESIATGMRAS